MLGSPMVDKVNFDLFQYPRPLLSVFTYNTPYTTRTLEIYVYSTDDDHNIIMIIHTMNTKTGRSAPSYMMPVGRTPLHLYS